MGDSSSSSSLPVKRRKPKPVARRTGTNYFPNQHLSLSNDNKFKDKFKDNDEFLLFADDFGCVVEDTEPWISSKPVISVATSSSEEDNPISVGAGLANMGNTCFLNSVLQCFTHSVQLVQGLYSLKHPTPCGSNEFCLICAIREQVECSLTSCGKTVFPVKLVENLSYFQKSFKRNQQEDAHEFMQCFLDRLASSLIDALPLESDNLVEQLFRGQVISKLKCRRCNCNLISDKDEPSLDLSLEIDVANSLSTALESFTKVEHLEDEKMTFTCDPCKQKASADKQLMLNQIPPICVFHLKRFKNYGSLVEKIDKHVDFPLEIDLQPYTSGGQTDNVDLNLKYQLYAVIVHKGSTSRFGHYYCYIRSEPNTWYKFDDSKVTSVSEASVLQEKAYILFYAKQGSPWFAHFWETFKPCLDNLSNTSPSSVLENENSLSIKTQRSFEAKDPSSQSNAVVPLSPINRVFKETTEVKDCDYVRSPQTPPRSPGFDLAEDVNTAEKTSNKRQRGKDEDKSTSVEAVKMCKDMPGKMLMEANGTVNDLVDSQCGI